MVLTVAITPSSTSTSIMRVPTVRIGSSRWTLRRSIVIPRASWIASTMSCEVTAPNRRPSSPAWGGVVSTGRVGTGAGSWARSVAWAGGLVGDREHRAVEHGRGLLGALGGLGEGAVGGLAPPPGRLDGALGGRGGELARDQVVAQVPLGDVDDGAPLAELLVVLQEDGLRHRGAPLAVAVATTAAAAAALLVAAGALADVGQQRQLAGALDRAGDLVLVPPAGAGDAARADLAAVGDELPEGDDVLVVDELDLVPAVLAGLAAPAA